MLWFSPFLVFLAALVAWFSGRWEHHKSVAGTVGLLIAGLIAIVAYIDKRNSVQTLHNLQDALDAAGSQTEAIRVELTRTQDSLELARNELLMLRAENAKLQESNDGIALDVDAIKGDAQSLVNATPNLDDEGFLLNKKGERICESRTSTIIQDGIYRYPTTWSCLMATGIMEFDRDPRKPRNGSLPVNGLDFGVPSENNSFGVEWSR